MGITGWEKWWQVELAAWFSEHEDIAEWVMEEVFYTDLRKQPRQDTIAIDLGFRRKRHATGEMIFLELKQNTDWRRCIDYMLRDIEKVYSAQQYSVENRLVIRSFFVVGLYPTGDAAKKVVSDYVEERTLALDIPFERRHLFTKFIKDSPYSVTVF